ncbi:MAG: alpha/beta hydrolase [Thermoleophilaceae bacterium]
MTAGTAQDATRISPRSARRARARAVARRRARLRRQGSSRSGARFALDGPRGIRVARNLPYGPLGPTLDVYRRAGARRPAAAVLVVHGGGWGGGGKGRMAPVSLALARSGFVAVNVGYMLATSWAAGFPRQPLQLGSAVRWIRRNADRLGVDPRRIGALGSSAGAHLASLHAMRGEGPLTRGTRVAAVVGWSAPVDLPAIAGHHLLGPAARTFVGCSMRTCPERWTAASPVTHVSPDDPPMLIVNSLREMIPVTQAERMAEGLSGASVPSKLWLLEGHRHARDYQRTVLDGSLAFLRRWLLY